MRIIAGKRRGAQLFAPKGIDTRPTQDRVKESLFNIIQAYVADATVLDLFAGSGALALESISRGARHASLVDMDHEAIDCIHKNVEKLGFEEQICFYPCQWQNALLQMKEHFDLVFLDPPYRMTELQVFCDALVNRKLLATDAMLVIEHKTGVLPMLDGCFELFNERRYGDSEIHFYLYRGGDKT